MLKILVLDTSILCVWLGVPGKDTCGQDNDRWDKKRVADKITEEERQGTQFVMPPACLIETGNHIAKADCKNRFELAQKLVDLLCKSLDEESPWIQFLNPQAGICNEDYLRALASSWPPKAAEKISIADATISDVAEYYAQQGRQVEILTGDAGLKAYEPAAPIVIPRRRR